MRKIKEQGKAAVICFEAKLVKIGLWTLLQLPKSASVKLPSRGMTLVKGTINDFHFQAALEPDGRGSHWFKVDKAVSKGARIDVGDTPKIVIEPSSQWPEPEVPVDLKKAVEENPQVHKLWMDITPMARWDWIRWIRSTKQVETRRRRIEVACSKLKKGERRPCCFNRTVCTDPEVSNNGVLLKPIHARE